MKDCCEPLQIDPRRESFKRALYIALVLNFLMFMAEVSVGVLADSVSLQADAMDFLGDSANYAISLFVLSHSLRTRAKASLLKAATMLVFGLWVLGSAVLNAIQGSFPAPEMMGALGLLAFLVNFIVAVLLYKFRGDDSNAKSVWLCTRNDVIGNIAVIGAASGVFLTGTMWPDLIVATIIAGLAIHSSLLIIRSARIELLVDK